MGSKKTLLLGWLTRGVRLAAGAAQARRDAVKRYGLAGGTQRSASARAGGEAKLGRLCGPHARVGGQAGLAGLARKAEQAWAATAPSSFLSLFLILFLFCFPFSFICCQFV